MSNTMAQNEKSTLARQGFDSWSHDIEEEVALLGGRFVWKTNNRNKKYWKIGTWIWTITSTIAAVVLVSLYSRNRIPGDKIIQNDTRNLVFMVSDGMGPASLSITRGYKQNITNSGALLSLDSNLVGTHRTRSANSYVSDSAAGATAFACGFKTDNGAVSVLPDGRPCGSVLEAAKMAGYMTGIVVTTYITDATPATFGSHVLYRKSRDLIAEQLIGNERIPRSIDLIIGGGRCNFVPRARGEPFSCREDERDLIREAQENDWHLVNDKAALYNNDDADLVEKPVLALLADDRMPYELDRQREYAHIYPTLAELTKRALEILQLKVEENNRNENKPKSKGFFLVVEGSQIDNTSHDNDAAAHVREVLAYDHAFREAKHFLVRKQLHGNLISTSDHETGGLSGAIQLNGDYPSPYFWNPSELQGVRRSAKSMGLEWLNFWDQLDNPSDVSKEVKAAQLLSNGLVRGPTQDEINTVVKFKPSGTARREEALRWPFGEVISKRALIGWSTHGHSAVDVNIYAYSTNRVTDSADKAEIVLRGNKENTDVGKFLARYLRVEEQQRIVTHLLNGLPALPLGPPQPDARGLEIELDSEYDDRESSRVAQEAAAKSDKVELAQT